MMGITGAVLVYAHDIEHLLGQVSRMRRRSANGARRSS